jgi:hypothetical protein
MELTDADLDLLAGIEDRAKTVRTRIRSVALGYTHAVFLHGPGGHGKSHIVTSELDETVGVGKWKSYKGDMSPRGMIDKLEAYPEAVHVLEDMETTFKEANMQSYLRAAMASPNGGPRRITDNKHNRDVNFIFHGGIIIVSNDSIDHRYGRLGAIASRTHPMLWKLSTPELAAMMRVIAQRGSKELAPEECMGVAEYLIEQMSARQKDTKVDLRTFCEGALPDFLQWKQGKSVVHWTKVVQARIQGEPIAENRNDRLARHRVIACQIQQAARTSDDMFRLWKEQTGLGKSSLYDRLKEAEAEGKWARFKPSVSLAPQAAE